MDQKVTVKAIIPSMEELVKKSAINIQNSAEEVRKYLRDGNDAKARYYMGLEKAYQNIYNDLTGQNYAPDLQK